MYKWWKITYYFGQGLRTGVIWKSGKVDLKEILLIAHDEEEAKKLCKMQIEHQNGSSKAINIFSIEPTLDK